MYSQKYMFGQRSVYKQQNQYNNMVSQDRIKQMVSEIMIAWAQEKNDNPTLHDIDFYLRLPIPKKTMEQKKIIL